MKADKYFKLFANCIPVKGKERTVICDLQRNLFVFVPHSLIEIFDESGLLNMESFSKGLDIENQEIFTDYVQFLLEHDFIFACNKRESKHFPPIVLDWDFPAQISNCIIDISTKFTDKFYANFINSDLYEVQCRHLQIRCYEPCKLEFLSGIMVEMEKSEIFSVDIVIKDCPDLFSHADVCSWVAQNRKVRCATLHSSASNAKIRVGEYGFGHVLTVKEVIKSHLHCGLFHPNYFVVNMEAFTESQRRNTCLNRKISIDANGEIKNCPSMAKSYGNIRDTKLSDVANDPEFQKVWHIHKDQIAVCRDCEFRYICTDCRAYLEDPEDMYSKPLKCGYNPYTCEWEEWSSNPLKQQAIDYYGMRNMLKNDEDNSPRKSE